MQQDGITIDRLLQQLTHAYGPQDVVAWVHAQAGWSALTFSVYWRAVSEARSALRELGLVSGERVVVCASTSVNWDIVQLAAMLEGACVLGLDERQPLAQRDAILRKFSVDWICSDNPGLCDEVRTRVPASGSILLGKEPLAPVTLRHERLRRSTSADLAGRAAHGPYALATLTSGTTSEPKIIGYTAGQVQLAIQAIGSVMDFVTAESRTIAWMPMAHLYQRIVNLVFLAKKAQVWYCRDPRRLPECIPAASPDVLIVVPKFLHGVVASAPPGAPAEHLRRILGPGLRYVVSGAASLGSATTSVLEVAGIKVLEAYGISENIVPVCMSTLKAHRNGSVGKPLPTNLLRLGAGSEIEVSGPGVFTGYLGEEETDAAGSERFTGDGYYRTGDVGEIDADGYVYLKGRISTYFKLSNGKRIYPEAIEAVYLRSPAVEQCFVFGDGHSHVCALVLPSARITDQPESMQRDLVAQALAAAGRDLLPYERIQGFHVLSAPFAVDQGEVTVSQKVRRHVIAERFKSQIGDLLTTPTKR